MIQYLGNPGAGTDVGIGATRVDQSRAARRATTVAAADSHWRAGNQAGAIVYAARCFSAYIVAGSQLGHAVDVYAKLLQQFSCPAAVINVQRRGERRVRIIGKTHASREMRIDVILDIHEPARAIVHLGQVFLEPEYLRQRVVRIEAVACERIEMVFIDDLADFSYLRAGAAVGMDDIRVQRVALRIHGDAAVHRAAQSDAGDALWAHLQQQFANAVEHSLKDAVRVLLGPVGPRIQRGIVAPHGGQRFALHVEHRAFAAGGAGV